MAAAAGVGGGEEGGAAGPVLIRLSRLRAGGEVAPGPGELSGCGEGTWGTGGGAWGVCGLREEKGGGERGRPGEGRQQ